MKKSIIVILLIALIVVILPIPVLANAPGIGPMFLFQFKNLPAGTKYVDMLIKLPESDECYVPLVQDNLPKEFSMDAPILFYAEKNFRSYTFHYAGAKSMIEIDGEDKVFFFAQDPTRVVLYEHEEDIYNRGKIRLAMLDGTGNILQVSRTLSLKPKRLFDYQLNTFHYDAKADSLEVDTQFDVGGMLFFLLLSVAGLVLTCLLEDWVALPFKLWKQYNELIFKTNLISQILMRLLHVMLYGWVFAHYAWSVVFLEMLVYFGEFLIYRWKMKDVSCTRVLWYTVAANTISLVIGIVPMMIV